MPIVPKLLLFMILLSISGILSIPKCFSQSQLNPTPSLSPGESLFERGVAIMNTRIDSAIHFWELAKTELAKEEKWEQFIICHSALFATYYRQNDFDSAGRYAQAAVELARMHLNANHSTYQSALSNLGSFYSRLGYYDRALGLTYEALKTAEQAADPDSFQLAKYYNNIGYNLRRKGDFAEGLRLYKKAAELQSDILGPNSLEIANNYNNQAKLLENIGQKNAANDLYLQAIEILQSYPIRQYSRQLQDMHHSVAGICVTQGKPKQALFHLEKADELNPFVRNPQLTQHYRIRADLYIRQNDSPKGLAYRKKELAEFLKLLRGRKKHPRVAESYQRLAEAYIKTGEIDSGLWAFQKALILITTHDTIHRTQINPELEDFLFPIDAIPIVRGKAKALYQRYQERPEPKTLKDAMRTYQLAVSLISRSRKELRSASSKLILAEQSHPVYEEASKMALQLFYLTTDATYLAILFDLMEQNKATLLYESLKAVEAKNSLGIPDSTLEQEKQIRADLAFYQKQIFDVEHGGKSADSTRMKIWKDKIFKLEQRKAQLESAIEQNFPAYYHIKYSYQSPDLQQVKEKLTDTDSRLVEYLWGDSSVFVMSISSDKVRASEIKLDNRLKNIINKFSQSLTDQAFIIQEGLSSATLDTFIHHASELYQVFLAPVMPNNSAELVIVPDGLLHFLPFDILLTQSDYKDQKSFAQLPYLLKSTHVRYGYSATLLLEGYKKMKGARYPEKYAGFAPDYDADDYVGPASRGRFSPLKNNRKEINQVVKMMGGNAYLGKDASESVFKQNTHTYEIFHLAMHAIVNDSLPAYSALIFSEAKDDESFGNEGILHAYEIYNLQIPASLAILSACQTGNGKMLRGEGVMSLARAFAYAGCRNIAMSLWQVDDETSSFIIERFFQNLNQGFSKSKALQKAKLAYLQEGDLKHPYYWAGFVLIGDNFPLTSRSNSRVLLWLIAIVILIIFYAFRKTN